MSDDRSRMLTLAKVLIAAAWADGEITGEEQNCLKDIIFHLSDSGVQLNAQEWAMLEMYIEAPIGADERTRLVADLQAAIQTPAERQYVLDALRQMAVADGLTGDEEQQVIQEISQTVQAADSGLLSGLNRLLGGAMKRRSTAVAGAPNREAYFDDYLQNKVYYETSRILREEGRSLNLSDAELRKLGLAGGLMTRIAHVDQELSEPELEEMVRIMQQAWQLDHEAAVFVVTVATSSLDMTYDYYRMTREFATNTTLEERQRFLVALFLVAGADGDVSFEETEEIRLVSRGINLSHEDFIQAKLQAKTLQG
jgi:uncharacterized tellurite resistance protein B-like protein